MAKDFADVLRSYDEKQQKEWELAQKLDETGEGKEIVDDWFKLIVSREEYGIIVDALEELILKSDSYRIREVLSDISSRKTLPDRKELLLATGLDIPGRRLEDK